MPEIPEPRSPLIPKLRGLHLFHFEGAPCAQRVRFAIAEKGLQRLREVPWDSDSATDCDGGEGGWVSRHVSLIKRDHVSEAYAEIHPHMVVPALVHDGVLWTESMDIVRYLDERFGGDPLVPRDPEAAREASQWVDDAKALHVSIRYVSFHWGLGRIGRIGAAKEALLKRLEPKNSPEALTNFYGGFDHDTIEPGVYLEHLHKLEAGFDRVDERLADGRAYLMGETFTLADIPWSIKVLRLSECGYPFARNYPRLHEWYRRTAARPGFRDGVMQKNRLLSGAFTLKAQVENLLGVGLGAAARQAA